MKATHTGHCQLCGREQKLPNDKLAKHGYSVEWSMFLGTCGGSDNLPYEKSAGLISAARTKTLLQLARIEEEASYLRNDGAEGPTVNIHYYERPTGRGLGGYKWVRADVSEYEVDGIRYKATTTGGQEISGQHTSHAYPHTKENIIRALNDRKASALDNEAASVRAYAKWLKEREEAWVLTDTKAI